MRIDHSHHAHTCPPKLLYGVYAALLFLTIVTVAVAKVDLIADVIGSGDLSLIVAVAIAAVKCSLVMAIFMHLKWDTAINNIAFLGSLIFLSLLFLFTLADFFSRGEANAAAGMLGN